MAQKIGHELDVKCVRAYVDHARVFQSRHVLLSSYYDRVGIDKQMKSCSNKKLFFTVPSTPRLFRTKRPMVGAIKVMYTGKQNSWSPSRCALCVAHILSHGTCVFVSHNIIGSRPIKLNNLLPRYNTTICPITEQRII